MTERQVDVLVAVVGAVLGFLVATGAFAISSWILSNVIPVLTGG